MQNLNRIGAMKEKVLESILATQDVVRLIENKKDVVLPAFEIRYKQVFPWKKILGTQEEAKTFVGFDISLGGAINCAVKTYYLNIWVMSHESLMPIDNKVGEMLSISDRGVRTDILADKLDYLLNGSTDMGFGKLEIVGSDVFRPAERFSGRNIQYIISGWNRYGEKL